MKYLVWIPVLGWLLAVCSLFNHKYSPVFDGTHGPRLWLLAVIWHGVWLNVAINLLMRL